MPSTRARNAALRRNFNASASCETPRSRQRSTRRSRGRKTSCCASRPRRGVAASDRTRWTHWELRRKRRATSASSKPAARSRRTRRSRGRRAVAGRPGGPAGREAGERGGVEGRAELVRRLLEPQRAPSPPGGGGKGGEDLHHRRVGRGGKPEVHRHRPVPLVLDKVSQEALQGLGGLAVESPSYRRDDCSQRPGDHHREIGGRRSCTYFVRTLLSARGAQWRTRGVHGEPFAQV